MELKRYTKKPVTVEADQITPSNIGMLAKVTGLSLDEDGHKLTIHTSEGVVRAGYGDWLVREVSGEMYPVTDSIFRAGYEPASGEPPF